MVSSNSYETTSSEDTSCDDSASDGDTETEAEGRAGDVEPEQAGRESKGASSGKKCEDDDEQEASAGAAPCSQHEAHR